MAALNMFNSNQVTFREMTLDDIDAIMIIEHEAFTLPWSAEAFRNEIIQNHFAHYLIMELNEEVIGYAGMWTVMDEAHITNIAVRTSYRGAHLGETLLRRLIMWARELGMERMTLEVRVSNHIAQALYRKLGFYSQGVRPKYYSDNNEDAMIMWCELDQISDIVH